MEKKLLSLKELCSYLGIGETKARELVRGKNGFQNHMTGPDFQDGMPIKTSWTNGWTKWLYRLKTGVLL